MVILSVKLETLSNVSSFRLNFNTLSSDKKNTEVNQLSIEIDQNLISPNSISPESNIKVMRVKEMITRPGSYWLWDKLSL